jgi:hypothetical protein
MGGIWGGMVNIMFEGLQKQEQNTIKVILHGMVLLIIWKSLSEHY